MCWVLQSNYWHWSGYSKWFGYSYWFPSHDPWALWKGIRRIAKICWLYKRSTYIISYLIFSSLYMPTEIIMILRFIVYGFPWRYWNKWCSNLLTSSVKCLYVIRYRDDVIAYNMRNSDSDVFIVIARSNVTVLQMRVHCSSSNLQIAPLPVLQ